jgi:hypothetical protein
MNTRPAINPYKRHRFPAEIISHSVWLYYRFSLSYRDVEELMVERGVPLSHEAVRYWCRKFGQAYANALRRRRPRPGDKWHLDEVFLTINKKRHYLWRAVDQDGAVLGRAVLRCDNGGDSPMLHAPSTLSSKRPILICFPTTSHLSSRYLTRPHLLIR